MKLFNLFLIINLKKDNKNILTKKIIHKVSTNIKKYNINSNDSHKLSKKRILVLIQKPSVIVIVGVTRPDIIYPCEITNDYCTSARVFRTYETR